jgi:hypothetical protein
VGLNTYSPAELGGQLIIHIVSTIAKSGYLPSSLDVVLDVLVWLLTETLDLTSSDFQSSIPQGPVTADKSVSDPIGVHLPISIQSIDEVLYPSSTMGIDQGDMILILCQLCAVFSFQTSLIHTLLDVLFEALNILS